MLVYSVSSNEYSFVHHHDYCMGVLPVQCMRMMPELTSEQLVPGVVAITVPFDVHVFNAFAESNITIDEILNQILILMIYLYLICINTKEFLHGFLLFQ